jgi:hypothetical protein
MKDLTNIAYSDEYTELKNRTINSAYSPVNKINENEIIDGNLKRIITEYRTKDEKYFCTHNKVYSHEENKFIFEYFNLYQDEFFCRRIKYNNGREYIFYKADLYGYNVFEMDTQKTFDYFPKCSFVENGIETFIGTSIYFNPNNNVFAVDGYYWACPTDILLIKIDNPLKQYEKYIDIHSIIDEGYEKYDDMAFMEWEHTDVKIKCYNREIKPEIIVLKENEYIEKMIAV